MPRVDGFVLPPLPNHLFTRDTSAWIYGGVSVQRDGHAGAAARGACTSRRSTATTRCSPAAPHEVWSDGLGGAAQLEGGDVLVIGNGCVLIGMGERTRPPPSSVWRSGCSRPARRAT